MRFSFLLVPALLISQIAFAQNDQQPKFRCLACKSDSTATANIEGRAREVASQMKGTAQYGLNEARTSRNPLAALCYATGLLIPMSHEAEALAPQLTNARDQDAVQVLMTLRALSYVSAVDVCTGTSNDAKSVTEDEQTLRANLQKIIEVASQI